MNGDVEIVGQTRDKMNVDTDLRFNTDVRPSKTPAQPSRPAPRQVLKPQTAGQKSTTSSVSLETTARKRPAEHEFEVVDESVLLTPLPHTGRVGPPSKKVKRSTQALGNMGSFFHIRIGNRTLKVL